MPSAFLGPLAFGQYGFDGWLRSFLIVLLLGVIAVYLTINTNYVVIATNQRTIVGCAGWLVTSRMRGVETNVVPHVHIQTSKGIFYRTTESLGTKMRYHTYFDSEVRTANARSVVSQ